MPRKRRKVRVKRIENLTLGLGLVLALVLVINIFQIGDLGEEVEKAKERARPAKVQLVTILDSGCDDCFDISSVIGLIERRVNITEEKTLEFDSETARKLVEKYGIEKIPTVLVSGEVSGLNKGGFREKEGVLIFEEVLPPYVKADDGGIKGLVSVTYLEESSCEVCPDLKELLRFERVGVKVVEEEKVEVGSRKGQELVGRYDIDKIPTVLLSEDIGVYEEVNKIWEEVGSVEEDGIRVLRKIMPPYFDILGGKVVGLVELIMITDQFCEECYDVRMHKQILGAMGLVFKEEKEIDINSVEGVKLRMKYGLKKVPTVILKGEVEAYEGFGQVWQQVGTVEEDGAYVFRELGLLGVPYKDLTTNEVTGLGVGEW